MTTGETLTRRHLIYVNKEFARDIDAALAAQVSEETPLSLAIAFHETYERLAPSFGYETRTETRTFDPTSKNGKLMVAVCGEIINRHFAAAEGKAGQ